MPELILRSGGRELARLVVDKAETTIGRDSGCDLHIDHPAVSPLHATLARDRKGFFVRDEGSKWGIVSGGKPVKILRLSDGDEFVVCKKFKIRFSAPGETLEMPPEREPEPEGEPEGHSAALDDLMEAAVGGVEKKQARKSARKRARQTADAGGATSEVSVADAGATKEYVPPETARALRERRELEEHASAGKGLTGQRMMIIALCAVILSCATVVAAAFF